MHIVIINAAVIVVVMVVNIVRVCGDGIPMANVAYNNTFGGCRRRRNGAHICCPIAIGGGHCDCITRQHNNWKDREDKRNENGKKHELKNNHLAVQCVCVCVHCGVDYICFQLEQQ